MKHMIFFFSLLAGLMLSGCFGHREAPERLVSAVGLEAALQRRDTVQKVDLGGLKLERVPDVLAEMPRLQCLMLRRAETGN